MHIPRKPLPRVTIDLRLAIVRFGLLMLILGGAADDHRKAVAADAPRPAVFARENLVAWCIVPFDARRRGPVERAEMLQRLGITRFAYDWRAEHVPTFEQEFLELQRRGIELFAFWDEHPAAFPLFQQHGLTPQIWKTCPSPQEPGGRSPVAAAADQLQPLVDRARQLGCRLGLYNHGGWGGEPRHLVAVCEHLRSRGENEHVGIVYNLHHGHEHLPDFAESLALMQPYLLCLNLNGMNTRPEPKILPIGDGEHDPQILETILASGYRGPIGLIGHRAELDAEECLLQNLRGLERLLERRRAAGDATGPSAPEDRATASPSS
jgi:hypothetical protein